MKGFQKKMCPRCHQAKMERWTDLTDEEKFLAERLPMSSDFSAAEREKHFFCPCCWLEIIDDSPQTI